MKTMKKLQIAAAAASLFAVGGVAQAATLNSSGSVIAAETIFPTNVAAPLGNNTKIVAPAATYQYEGGVNAASRQIFKVALNLTNGAQWARDTTRVGDPFLDFFRTDGRQAATINAVATVNGTRGRVAVLNNADPGANEYAIVLRRIEAGNTIGGTIPFTSDANSAVTYVFEVVNNTAAPNLNLEQLALTFSIYKPAGAAVLPNSAPDTATTAIDQFATIYNLASLSVDTNANPCLEPTGAVRLQAVSGNNDPAVISQEDTVNNNQSLRDVGNYILIRRATSVALTKDGDRIVQVTNSFPVTSGTTPVNGMGGHGGGRYTFKPTRESQAIVYGGSPNSSGFYSVDNSGAPNNTVRRDKATFPERSTTGDERAAKLGTLTFANIGGNPLDRRIDIDPYAFKPEIAPVPPAVSVPPSGPGQVGDFSVPPGAMSTEGNIMGGVDLNGAPITATPLSGAVIIQARQAGGFAPGATLTLQRNATTCADTPPPGSITPSTVVSNGITYWRFSRADLLAASGLNGGTAGTVLGNWAICYNVTGETSIPQTSFTEVMVTVLKDDTTEQPLKSCAANLASIYGGVVVDVRNFLLHQLVPGTVEDKKWRGILRIVNNSELDTMLVEAQYIHEDGRYGPWGTLGTWAPRAARYVVDTDVIGALTTPVTNPTAEVNNAAPTTQTARLRIEGTGGTIRVQNYAFNLDTKALTEISTAQGADFMNIQSSNRDHIDQDAQFNIVKDGATLLQRLQTVGKGTITPNP